MDEAEKLKKYLNSYDLNLTTKSLISSLIDSDLLKKYTIELKYDRPSPDCVFFDILDVSSGKTKYVVIPVFQVNIFKVYTYEDFINLRTHIPFFQANSVDMLFEFLEFN